MTSFFQDKYKRKKVAPPPSPSSRHQAYYDKGPERIFNLSVDSLAVMLSLANVASGGSVLARAGQLHGRKGRRVAVYTRL